MKKIAWLFIGLTLLGAGCGKKEEPKEEAVPAPVVKTSQARVEVVSRTVVSGDAEKKVEGEGEGEGTATTDKKIAPWVGLLATERLAKIPDGFSGLKKFLRSGKLEVYDFTLSPSGDVGAFYSSLPGDKNPAVDQVFIIIKDNAGNFTKPDPKFKMDTNIANLGKVRMLGEGMIPKLNWWSNGAISLLTTDVEVYDIHTPGGGGINENWTIQPLIKYEGDGYFGNVVFDKNENGVLVRRQGFNDKGTSDQTENVIKLVPIESINGDELVLFSQTADHPLNLYAIGFSADGKWVLAIENGSLVAYRPDFNKWEKGSKQVLASGDYLESVGWKPETSELQLIKTDGGLENFVLKFYDENGQVVNAAVPPPSAPVATDKTLPAGVETWGSWSHPLYKFSFKLPLGVAAQMTSKTDVVFQDPATKTGYASIQIAKEIPQVPLPANKIENIKLDGVDAKIFHNADLKDGKTKIDQLWVKIPKTDMVLFFQSPVWEQENFDFQTVLKTWQWSK